MLLGSLGSSQPSLGATSGNLPRALPSRGLAASNANTTSCDTLAVWKPTSVCSSVAPEAWQPRVSTRAAATAQRRQMASRRQTPVLNGTEPVEGLLRRQKVKPKTAKLYLTAVKQFHEMYGVGPETPLPTLDRLLDTEIVNIYLRGERPAEGRILFYAMRWHHSLRNEQLPKSSASRVGFNRQEQEIGQEPVTWEATMLAARAILATNLTEITKDERLACASAMLLGFDAYARGGDMTWTTKVELRPPILHVEAAAFWTLTMWPSTSHETSKTNTQDATKAIGVAKPRAWLSQLCPILLRLAPQDPRLIPLTQDRYVTLFHRAFALASLPPCTPHRLRHGGASADGMLGSSDAEILIRGDWRCLASIQRYRRPARYLRQLSSLTKHQLSKASASPTEILKLARTCVSRKRSAPA